jgi:hypothetical protein
MLGWQLLGHSPIDRKSGNLRFFQYFLISWPNMDCQMTIVSIRILDYALPSRKDFLCDGPSGRVPPGCTPAHAFGNVRGFESTNSIPFVV